MKKKYLLILMLFCLTCITGCTVDYNLDFTDEELKEVINVNLTASENNKENIEKMEYSAKYEAAAISKQYNQVPYNFTSAKQKDKYVGTFSYDYTITEFNDAHLIRTCYDSFNFVQTENGYQLITSDTFKCGSYSYLPVEKYTITVTSNHKVIESNADMVDKNKYTWIIKPNGKVNIEKPIKIVFSNETSLELMSDELANNSKLVTFIVLGVLGCAIIITSIVFMIKTKKNGN